MRTRVWLGLGLALAASVDARSTRTEPEARWQAWEQHQALQQSSWFGGLQWHLQAAVLDLGQPSFVFQSTNVFDCQFQ